MRASSIALLLALFTATLHALEEEPTPPPLPPREAAMDVLFQIPPSPEELAKAEAEARRLGIPEQTILEARFLFLVENKNDKGIIELLPSWEKLASSFTLDHSEIFATREDFLAVIEFAEALKALQEKKYDSFKKHITEALWLSPSQASAFTPYIQELRLQEHIKKTTIPLDASLTTLDDSTSKTLQQVLGDQNGILLQFWSPWSADCETSMNEFSLLAADSSQQFAIATVLIDGKTEILSEAREWVKGLEKALPGNALVDRAKDSLAAKLRITELPTLVGLDRKGNIFFHGRPDRSALKSAIAAQKSLQKKP